MRLINNAEKVAKRAWSVWLIGFAAALNAGAIVLPLMVAAVPTSMLVGYGIVTFLVIVGAGCARFIHQDNVSGDPDGDH